MRKRSALGLVVLVASFIACGDDGSSGTTGTIGAAGNAGASGATGVKGGAGGLTSAGAGGKAASGAAGSTTAGAAGSKAAGASGSTTAGAAGTSASGAGGTPPAGASGAAGSANAGQSGASGSTGGGGSGAGTAGAAGNAGGTGNGGGDGGGSGGATAGAGGTSAGQAGKAGTNGGGAGGKPTTTCNQHRACEAGEALGRSCSLCINQVCDVKPSCCDATWDAGCVEQAQKTPVCDCAAPGGAGGGAGAAGGPPVVCHDSCETGTRLDESCGTCAANVCAIDSFCCTNEWDEQCVFKASNVAEGCSCAPIETCHSPCTEGDPLGLDCDPCAADVCGALPECCDTAWTAACVALAQEACVACGGGSGGSSGGSGSGGSGGPRKCPDNPCIPGGKSTTKPVCDACVESVIAAKPTCSDGWKQGCADLAKATASCGCGP